jgi:hypothetical protein
MITRMADLSALVKELEAHAGESGWDQPARLFALVDTAELLEREPQLRGSVAEAEPGMLTPIEQDPVDGDLAEFLAAIAWPEEVLGCALVNEVWLLPETAGEAPDAVDPDDWVAEHPQRRDVRISVAVLRDGSRHGCLRVRGAEGDEDEVVVAEDLVPNLVDALLDTLAPDVAED